MKINEVQNKIDPKRFCIANKAIRKIGYNVRKGEKKRERGSQQHGQGEIERDKESGRERERGREREAERERKIEGH